MDALVNGLPYILGGIPATLYILFGAIGIGLVCGLAIALIEAYAPLHVALLARLPEQLLRSVPCVILLYLFYFTLLGIPPIIVALLALGLRSGAYQSQIFYTAITSIGGGQMMAARSLGMSKVRSAWRIVLPQAIRRSIGPWTNEYAIVTKDTSYAYLVGIAELLRRARIIIAASYGNAVLIYGFCAVVYYLIIRIGCLVLYRLERRFRVPGFEVRGGVS